MMKKLLAIVCAAISVLGALFFVVKLMGRFCKKGDKVHGVEVPLDGEDGENPKEADGEPDGDESMTEDTPDEETQA